jgi:serine/threonine protein kinase
MAMLFAPAQSTSAMLRCHLARSDLCAFVVDWSCAALFCAVLPSVPLCSDFGLGHQLNPERNWQISGQAGTRGYQSPEVLRNDHYGCEVDVFSYGVTVYELLHGQRPWKEPHTNAASPRSGSDGSGPDLSRFADFPVSSKLSAAATSFLRGLLAADWTQRLGCAPRATDRHPDGSLSRAELRVHWEEMRAHAFFDGIDWDQLYAKKVAPPFAPDNSRANCSPEADLADQLLDAKPRAITAEQQKNFEGWDFNTDLRPAHDADGQKDAAAAPADQTQPTQPSPAAGSVGAGRLNGHQSLGSEEVVIDDAKQRQQQ